MEIGCAPRNFRPGRPAHLAIEAVVIHLIDGSQAGADATFLDNALDVVRSAHYSVGKQGRIHQYVKEEDTAFHAGKILNPSWPQMKKVDGAFVNPNFYTIGIEHEGRPNDEWPDAMYASSAALLKSISERYPALNTLNRSNVVMHRQIRADKSCPGFTADLDRLLSEAAAASSTPVLTPNIGIVTTAVSLNLRDRPSVGGRVLRVLPPDTVVHVVGHVPGDAVKNPAGQTISGWYQTVEDEYLWSGGTGKPVA
jgi:hypothetical protein